MGTDYEYGAVFIPPDITCHSIYCLSEAFLTAQSPVIPCIT